MGFFALDFPGTDGIGSFLDFGTPGTVGRRNGSSRAIGGGGSRSLRIGGNLARSGFLGMRSTRSASPGRVQISRNRQQGSRRMRA